MQLTDYLDWKCLEVREFAVIVGERLGLGTPESIRADETKLNAITVKVWRHANAKRRPGPEDIEIYAELTEGAVTAQDWVTLALRPKQPPPDEATAKVAATG